jgi:uncharacterized RDD family membrane protein YckC
MSGLTAADVGDALVAATPVPPTRYAGLATRIVSFTIDAALITVVDVIILTADLEPVKPKRALVRCVGVILAALPLFLGFVPILYDSRRRGFQDQFAHTVVIDAPGPSIAEVSRAKKRAIYEASRMPASEVQARSQLKNGAP